MVYDLEITRIVTNIEVKTEKKKRYLHARVIRFRYFSEIWNGYSKVVILHQMNVCKTFTEYFFLALHGPETH